MSFKSTSRNALFALVCCGLLLGACAAYEAGEAPGAAAAAAAPEPPPPPELTEEQKLVARYVEASGGEEAIRAHTSITAKGAFEIPAMGMSGEATEYSMAPDKTVAIINIPGFGENVTGYNGEIGWAEDPMQGPRLLDGEELAQAKREARFYAQLEYDELFPEQTAVGETEFNGQTVHQLDLVDGDGNESSQYFAADTGLLVGMETTQTSEMGTVEVTITMSDYKEFGGVLLPTSTNINLAAMGIEFTQTIESVTFDDVDPSVFEPSDAIKALLPE